jgi:hypothetical protein
MHNKRNVSTNAKTASNMKRKEYGLYISANQTYRQPVRLAGG